MNILGGMFLTNWHLLILDEHGNRVTLEVIKHQAQEVGLVMTTIPSHTFHALWPLGVSCFKSFKKTFKKVRNVDVAKNNYMELDKNTLVGCVDQALDWLFTK